MKGLVIGIVVWIAVSTSIPYGAGAFAGFILGAVATYLIWRMDGLARQLRELGSGRAQEPTSAPDAQTWNAPPGAVPVVIPTQPPLTEALKAAKAPPAPPPAPPRKPLIRMQDLEALLAGRLLAVVGGLALVIGGVFFLGLAFSRGWIGPEARVVLGLVVGFALFVAGSWFLLRPGNRTREVLAHVLVAVGLAVIALALFAATRLYTLVSPEVGVGGAFVAAGSAAVLAILGRSQLVAGFGLVAVLAAPPVMGAGASLITVLFLGAALAGTTAICLFISWRWLPTVAFLLTVPQLAIYLGSEPPLGIGLAAVIVFWALNALSAAGEEVRHPSDRLSATSASLLVASAAFAVWAGFEILEGSLEPLRGLYIVGFAIAHLALGSFFLVRNGERHPFGMLVFGSGIAALTLAVPVQLGARWVPMAWAAEAVALVWVYAQRTHLYAGVVAVVLGALSLGHLLTVEYPLGDLGSGPASGGVPFVNPSGAALAFVTLAAAVAIALLRRRVDRIGVAGVMALVIVIVLPQELKGVGLVAAFALFAAAGVLVERRWQQIPLFPPREPRELPQWPFVVAERALYAPAILAGVELIGFSIGEHLPLSRFFDRLEGFSHLARRPFFDEQSLVAALVIATALAIGFGAGDRIYRWAGCVVAAVTFAYLVPFELGAGWAVVSWLGLALGLHVLATRWEINPLQRRWVTGAFVAASAAEILGVIGALDRLVVRSTPFPEAAVFNSGTLAVAAMAAALVGRAFLPPRDRDARIAGVLGGAWGVYLLSIATVDIFQANLDGGVALEELEKQAQVALSVLWAILGVAAFVTGLVRRSTIARLFGLGLLAVVTAKVFIVDLAALDVAYRVLSFVALGLLLLGAAYLASRFQPDRVD